MRLRDSVLFFGFSMLVLAFAANAQVPDLAWAATIGGTGIDKGHGITLDASGNVYVVGSYNVTADFDPGPGVFNLTATGSYDAYIAKYDVDGNLLWAKTLGGSNVDEAYGVALDPSGNVYATGYYHFTLDVEPIGPGPEDITSAGSEDVFIAKLDGAGNFIWVKSIGGTARELSNAIAVDAFGNVHTTGVSWGLADFDPGTGSFPMDPSGDYGIFISKLDTDGNFVWAKSMVGDSNIDTGNGIAVDATGNVYTTGVFTGTTDFNPGGGTFNLTSATSAESDVFISKLDAAGNFVWAKSFGGTGFDYGVSLALDPDANVYTGGRIGSASADIDPGPGIVTVPFGGFVSKLDVDGNFVWGKVVPGLTVSRSTMSIDASRNVYYAGVFASTIDFDPGAGVYNLTADYYDAFILKLNSIGDFEWATSMGGAGWDEVFSISIGPLGNVHTTGEFEQTVDFKPGGCNNNLTSAGAADVFIQKLGLGTTLPPMTFTSFVPTSGPIGTSVTITGTNFDPLPANNIVYFGATRATVTVATSTELTVTVPLGATYQPISVLVSCRTVYSGKPFVVTFPGNGNIDASTFAAKVDFTMASGPSEIIFGDLDGDGKADIATINDLSSNVSVRRNTSTPGTISFDARIDLAGGSSSQGMEVGDIDGDGLLDLISVSDGAAQMSVYRNSSSPGTINFPPRVSFSTGTTPVSVAIGDLDGDGRTDVALVNAGSNSVSIYHNTGPTGTISFAPRVNFTTGTNPYDVAIADLDGDNLSDVMVSSRGTNIVSVFRNTSTPGTISLDARVDIAIGAATQPFGVAIGDLDGDNKPDIVTSNSTSRTVSVVRNNSTPGTITTGSFDAPVSFATSASNPTYVSLGDMNGDSKLDLIVGNNNGTIVQVLKNNSTSGPFTAASFSASVSYGTGTRPYTVKSGDLDGDGKPELAVANVNSNTISVLRNTSTTSCVPVSERNALIALYNATDGANWTDNTNWLSSDESTWHGVAVTGCNITGIQLDGNNLVGNIPTEIGNFPFLESLEMGANQLSGSIPPEIGNLSSLIYLNLGVNSLSGNVPFEMENLSSLEVLYLGFNALEGHLPVELENLDNLTDAYLNNNLFIGTLPLLGRNSPGMNSLDVRFNNFTDIPDFLTYPAINFINVSFNKLTFDDLEPYVGITNFFYDPQARIPPGGIVSFIPGGTLNIPFSTGGSANSYQWYKDNVIIPGATSASYSLPGATAAAVGTYEVRITSSIVPLLTLTSESFVVITDPCDGVTPTTGDLDTGFAPLISVPSDFNDIWIQSTGKIITSTSNTVENGTSKSGVLRFNTDGTLDNTFSVNPYAGHFLVQPDDKIIATHFDGTYSFPVRLNADGTDDATFNSNAPQYYSGSVNALAYQPSDNKILVAGTAYMTPPFVERLNPDGTSDGVLPDADDLYITVMTVQSDGYILVGGEFSGGIRRLDPTGVLDPTFSGTASDFVMDIVEQPDGKILVAGLFYLFNDVRHYGVVRLNADGSVDNTFLSLSITDHIESGHYVTKIALQPDGKIVLAGLFETIDGASRRNLVRLNADGTVDCSFDPAVSTDTVIRGLAIQSDGKILITGDFTDYNGTQRYGLARVNNGGVPIITITLQPVNTTVCTTSSALLTTNAAGTTNITYQWQRYILAGSLIQNISNGGAYAGVTTSTLTIDPSLGPVTGDFYRCVISGDGATAVNTNFVTVTISPGPSAPTTTGASSCSAGALTLTAAGGINGEYRWYTVATGGTAIPGEVNDTYTTPVITTTTIYHVALFDGTCESSRTPVTATIEVVAKPTIVTSNCTAVGATLTGPGGFPTYSWSNGATTQQIDVTLAGSYTLTVTSAGGCPSPLSDPTTFTSAFCNQPPVIQPTTVTTTIQSSVTINISSLASDLDNNIDMTTLQVVVQPLSGAVASVNANFEIIVDYSAVSFAGTDELTIQVCDVSGACVQQVITIEVAGDITVYNAISPNGDGKNDVFFIQYIDALPETQQNKVTILNRWGSVVFETTNYNNTSNVFRGLSSGGAELPTGTYYYVLEFTSGASKRTGFISLRR